MTAYPPGSLAKFPANSACFFLNYFSIFNSILIRVPHA